MTFSAKDPDEIITVTFDFAALTSGVLSNALVTAEVESGNADPAAAALVNGAPTVSGSKILQRIVGGISGSKYSLRCRVDAADGSRYVLSDSLEVNRF